MTRRRFDFDLLRAVFMFGVIYLHTAAPYLRDLSNRPVWEFSNLLACFFTPAVPLFFMMSGALLLGSDRTLELDYLMKKRLPRLLVPLCAYSALALLLQAALGNAAGAADGLWKVFNTPVLVPYWFLYALIPMYLISPFLRLMARQMDDRLWNFLMGLWLFTRLLYTLRLFTPFRVQVILTEQWEFNLNFIGGYLGYFLLGAWLDRRESVPSRGVLLAGTAAALAAAARGPRWDTLRLGEYSSRFTDYRGLFTVVLSALLFLLARSLFREREGGGGVPVLLTGNSMAVYLLHPLVLGAWERLWPRLTGGTPASVPAQAALWLAVCLTCVGAAAVCASLPGLCYPLTGQSFREACRGSNLQALFSGKGPADP